MRWRRWLIRLLLAGVFLGLLGAVLVTFVIVQSGRRLQNTLAATSASDPGWQLADIEAARPTLADNENAAQRMLAVRAQYGTVSPTGSKWLLPTLGSSTIFDSLTPEARLNAAQKAALAKEFAGKDALRSAMRDLADLPNGRFPITWLPNPIATLLPNIQDCRESASYLRYDLHELAESGDRDGCLRAWRAMLNCQRAIGDEPSAICGLVRIAVRAISIRQLERLLAQCDYDDHHLAAFQAELESESRDELLLKTMRSERAICDQTIVFIKNDGWGKAGLGSPSSSNRTEDIATQVMQRLPGFMDNQRVGCLEAMNEIVAIARLPETEQRAAMKLWEGRVKELPILARLLVPALAKIGDACYRDRALLRMGVVAVAAERFRLRTGRFPDRLNELVNAGLMKSVPRDSYRDAELNCVRKSGGRWVVYSVGPDGQDNGGDLGDRGFPDVGMDFGITLFEPRWRRQEPVPPVPNEVEGETAGGAP